MLQVQPNQDPTTANTHPVEAGHIAKVLEKFGARFGLQTGGADSLNVLSVQDSHEAESSVPYGTPAGQLSPEAAARAEALKRMPEQTRPQA